MTAKTEYLLEMRNINKAFPGVQALADVTLKVKYGEVHGLVGENGAGKSTLIKILSGSYKMDSGEILLSGKPVQISNPAQAQSLGISTIHQEFNLINDLSIAENIFLSDFPRSTILGWLDKKKMRAEAENILKTLGLEIDSKILIKNLSVAQQQIVEIAKVLTKNAQIIIMDEPTAALTDLETKRLFEIIHNLTLQNVAIIYISHRLEELFQISDHITVLRDGLWAGGAPPSEISQNELIRLMVGSEVKNLFPKEKVSQGKIILQAENVNVKGLLKNISFKLHRGEILGVTGLMGSGQISLAQTLFGLHKIDSGRIMIEGKLYHPTGPISAIKHTLGLLTENRKEEGLVLDLSMRENISLANINQVAKLGYIFHDQEKQLANKMVQKLDIRPTNVERTAQHLSGGNQQKVVLAKWLAIEPEIIILCEPTRGVDVGAKTEIYRLMNDLVKQGKALLFISSELPEIIALSDRILTMRSGEIVTTLDQKEATQELIMTYGVGGKTVG